MRNKFKRMLSFVMIVALIGIAGITGSVRAADWWEKVKVKGDFRYRHEMIKKYEKDARHRQRIRARIGIFAKANDIIDIGIRLATGSYDPASTNQTLDNASSSKDIRLDLAYFKLHCDKISGLTLAGGKIKNPFYKPGKSELIWDGDWNPEGGVISYNHSSDGIELTLNGSGLWIDEDSKKDDVVLFGGQGIAKIIFNEKKSSLVIGGSYFIYNNIKGHKALYEVDDPKGNSVDEISDTTFFVTENDDIVFGSVDKYYTYQNEYELFELFMELNHKFNKIPASIVFDYVTNTAADSLKNGLFFGVHLGKTKNAGSWAFRYSYREVEKDAVIGAFTDSDFRGGGTNGKGHEIGGSYQLMKNTTFSVNYFKNEINIDQTDTEDFDRLQFDLQLKF